MRKVTIPIVILLTINLILLNVWLYPLSVVRADLTAQHDAAIDDDRFEIESTQLF